MGRPTRGVTDYLLNLGYRAVIGFGLALPYRTRVRFAGWAVTRISGLARWRQRIRDNLELIRPDMPRTEVERMTRAVPNNFGRSLIESFSGPAFISRMKEVSLTGGGVAALEEAHRAGRPVILITGHFGNHQAPRTALIARGSRL